MLVPFLLLLPLLTLTAPLASFTTLTAPLARSPQRTAVVSTGLDDTTLRALAIDAAADVASAVRGEQQLPSQDKRFSSTAFKTVRFDTVGFLGGVLFTVQMYVDGVCPDYSWEYTPPHAPSSSAAAFRK